MQKEAYDGKRVKIIGWHLTRNRFIWLILLVLQRPSRTVRPLHRPLCFYFQVLLNIVIIVLLSYFIYAFLKLLLTRKLKKQTLLLLYLIYFVALFYLLFLKNIGLQGLSLNPLSFARELYWGSHFVPIMNLLMFIPLGLLFPSRLSNLLLCLIALFSIESIQYFGHMGIFDLGDIILNTLGILIGNAVHQLPQFQTLIKKIIT